MAPKLYIFNTSAPARAVRMLIKHIGLDIEIRELDFSKEIHLSPEFLKLNPTHTVPTLVEDDGFVLWESHAILPYLVQKYAKDDSLYPKDLKQRAIVDQMLNFDNGSAFARLVNVAKPIFLKQKDKLTQKDYSEINEIYGFIERFLANNKWVAGDNPTIADYGLFATISSSDVIIPVDGQKYPKLMNWLEKCESLPGAEANKESLQALATQWKMAQETN